MNFNCLTLCLYSHHHRTHTARIQRVNCLDTDFHNTVQRHQIARKNRNWIMFVLVSVSRGCLYQIPHAIELRNGAGELNQYKTRNEIV